MASFGALRSWLLSTGSVETQALLLLAIPPLLFALTVTVRALTGGPRTVRPTGLPVPLLPRGAGHISVRPLLIEREAIEAWRIDERLYGDAVLRLDDVLSWWRVYPRGLHGVFDGETIVGFIGLWPVRKRAFSDLLDGSRAEQLLRSTDFVPVGSAQRHRLWYISGITIEPAYRRRRRILRSLVFSAIHQWLEPRVGEAEVHVCALGFSRGGLRMLQRFGFQERELSDFAIHQYPLYVWVGTADGALIWTRNRAAVPRRQLAAR